jgi:hypothetical protein
VPVPFVPLALGEQLPADSDHDQLPYCARKRAPVTDIEDAALHGSRPAELLSLAGCSWLDAKGGVYRLDDPAKAEEIVKDVACNCWLYARTLPGQS